MQMNDYNFYDNIDTSWRENLIKHQLETLNELIGLLKINQRVAVVRPTGWGKSRLIQMFLNKQSLKENEKVLFIEPASAIIDCIEKELNNPNIIFMTYQKLCSLKDVDVIKFYFSNMNIKYIILDEVHRSGAGEWGIGVDALLVAINKAKVIGLTATTDRNDGVDVIKSIFSDIQVKPLNIYDAIRENILPSALYVTALYDIEGNAKFIETAIMQSKKSVNIQTGLIDELKRKVLEMYDTMNAPYILNKYMAQHPLRYKNMKFIVFCTDIQSLKEMQFEIASWFKTAFKDKILNVYIVHTDKDDNIINKEVLEDFSVIHNDNIVDIVLSVNMLNEGVHISNVTSVVMLRKTNSHIIYLQQLGRCMSFNSDSPVIFDLINNYKSVGEVSYSGHALATGGGTHKPKTVKESILIKIFDEVKDFANICEDILKKVGNNVFVSNLEAMALLNEYKHESLDFIKAKFKEANFDYSAQVIYNNYITMCKNEGLPILKKDFTSDPFAFNLLYKNVHKSIAEVLNVFENSDFNYSEMTIRTNHNALCVKLKLAIITKEFDSNPYAINLLFDNRHKSKIEVVNIFEASEFNYSDGTIRSFYTKLLQEWGIVEIPKRLDKNEEAMALLLEHIHKAKKDVVKIFNKSIFNYAASTVRVNYDIQREKNGLSTKN